LNESKAALGRPCFLTDVICIGVTGGIGCGKSTAAGYLQNMGLSVVDTDHLARAVVDRGSEGLREVVSAFGNSILSEDGSLNRSLLALRVFSNRRDLETLEAILHPRIQIAWQTQINRWIAERKTIGVVVVPLLFEKGYAGEFDRVIAIGCSFVSQMARLTARGWNREEIDRRMAFQWPVDRKMEAADRAIWTEGSPANHMKQWRRLLEAMGWSGLR